MFVRFVIKHLDPSSGRRQGLFQAARKLRASGDLSREDRERLEQIRAWFNAYLRTPSRLAISSRPHAKAQAIGWFKNTATGHIAKMHEFQRILESYGVAVEMIRTRRPGYVVYEDEYQIAAYPFRDTRT